jgi:Fe-S-cluster containining protein
VWIDDQELAALAGAMGLPPEGFAKRFVRQVGARQSLTEYPDGDCILLDPDTRRCSVYHARPQQCRTWPFWPQNLATPARWEATCEQCPGSGRGQLFTVDEIRKITASHPVAGGQAAPSDRPG